MRHADDFVVFEQPLRSVAWSVLRVIGIIIGILALQCVAAFITVGIFVIVYQHVGEWRWWMLPIVPPLPMGYVNIGIEIVIYLFGWTRACQSCRHWDDSDQDGATFCTRHVYSDKECRWRACFALRIVMKVRRVLGLGSGERMPKEDS